MLKRPKLFWSLAVVLLCAVFVGGLFLGSTKTATDMAVRAGVVDIEMQPDGVDLAPIWKVWRIIDDKFVDVHAATSTTETNADITQERIWGMARGLAESTGDPYTVFMPPSEAESFQDDINGSFEGVGMQIEIRDGVLTVVSPLKDTPAWNAGIASGDLVLAIDDVDTSGMNVQEAVERIRGPRGTTVTLTIAREGVAGTLEIPVVRDVINVPVVETTLRDDGVFVIELMSFTATSPELFRQALLEFVNTHTDKLIIDLRGNPGGYLDAAVDMASWFLPKGAVVVTEDYGDKQDAVVHRSRGYDVFNENLKLTILIDRGSASASEILAGALSKHGKATLVGTRSFGKGSVQELIDITSDTALKVTVARWIFFDNSWIADTGLTPDVIVDLDTAQKDKNGKLIGDPIMDAAIEFLTQ